MKECKHTESIYTRDGKECRKCGLSWSLALRENRKRQKLQIKSKGGNPKRVPPEKRMKRYRKNASDTSKIPFTKFVIVVPTEEDKKELQATFEYFHDNRLIDTGFITVNQLAHQYLEPPDGNPFILVDEDTFRKLEQQVCSHPQKYEQDGIMYCKTCWKALDIDRSKHG